MPYTFFLLEIFAHDIECQHEFVYSVPGVYGFLNFGHRPWCRGVAAVKFLVGQKKIAKKGSIFFPIWAKNNFELGKKKNIWRRVKKSA